MSKSAQMPRSFPKTEAPALSPMAGGKFQYPNSKLQINSNGQMTQTALFEICLPAEALAQAGSFGHYLIFGAWNLEFV